MAKSLLDNKIELIGKTERGIDISPSPPKKQPAFRGWTIKRSLSRHSGLSESLRNVSAVSLFPVVWCTSKQGSRVRLHTHSNRKPSLPVLCKHSHITTMCGACISTRLLPRHDISICYDRNGAIQQTGVRSQGLERGRQAGEITARKEGHCSSGSGPDTRLTQPSHLPAARQL